MRKTRSETLWLCGPYSFHPDCQPFQALSHSPGSMRPSPQCGPVVGLSTDLGGLAMERRVLCLSFQVCQGERTGGIWSQAPQPWALGSLGCGRELGMSPDVASVASEEMPPQSASNPILSLLHQTWVSPGTRANTTYGQTQGSPEYEVSPTWLLRRYAHKRNHRRGLTQICRL